MRYFVPRTIYCHSLSGNAVFPHRGKHTFGDASARSSATSLPLCHPDACRSYTAVLVDY